MPTRKWKHRRTWKNLQELEVAIDEYFDECDKQKEVYDEAGLALYLGVSLQTLQNWYDGVVKKDYQDAVRQAYLRIQHQVAVDPRYMDKALSTRAIFLLKQARLGGYQDKVEAKQEVNLRITGGKGIDPECYK